MTDRLNIKSESECRWDIVSLGEVMLRFDPGDDRIQNARNFRVWEGGGEYNVARNLAKCFRQRAAVITALADNQIGRLVEDLVQQGAVDVSQIRWIKTDGISRRVRNGMYFMERGHGSRQPTGCSDRGNTAVSKLNSGDIDWRSIFTEHGTRWFHTGGIFAALSETTADVAGEAMKAARESGVTVSYDLNYRASLWTDRGGRDAANKLNRELLQFTDVVFGVEGFDAGFDNYSEETFRDRAGEMMSRYPGVKVVATTLRDAHSASRHSIGGAMFADGEVSNAKGHGGVDVLDRVGSGDAFAAGVIFGILSGRSAQQTIDLAAASAALAVGCAGDGLTATRDEIERAATSAGTDTVR